MDIKCLMGLYPKEYLPQIESDSLIPLQNAANNFQWALVKGFASISNVNVSICNSLYIGSYPQRHRKKTIPTFSFSHDGTSENLNVGFNNRSVIKIFSKYKNTMKELNKWAKQEGDNKVLLVYALTDPFIEIAYRIKTKYPNITVCYVVPDLPEYMNSQNGERYIKQIFFNRYKKFVNSCLKRIDCFVLLTEQMKEWFSGNIKYIVVEGISSLTDEQLSAKQIAPRRKSILYAGLIEERYGVVDLVKAFIRIDNPEWVLELYGSGKALEKIKKISEKDKRICIYGMVSNSVVLEAQKTASLLVNPRNNSGAFTKYSFPSKVMEYLSSGTPMLAYMLDGMPEEYSEYFYNIEEVKDGLFEALSRVMAFPESQRLKMGEKAQRFILEKKTAEVQCQKIIELFQSVNL